jgi:hypothetical protein
MKVVNLVGFKFGIFTWSCWEEKWLCEDEVGTVGWPFCHHGVCVCTVKRKGRGGEGEDARTVLLALLHSAVPPWPASPLEPACVFLSR